MIVGINILENFRFKKTWSRNIHLERWSKVRWRLENDARTGQGIMNWINGDKYSGDWINNIRTGKGEYTFKNGHKYIGGFLNNYFHGQGTFYFNNGDKYVGRFSDSKEMVGGYIILKMEKSGLEIGKMMLL